ncbi:MAG: hypothetical protein JW786_13875, partial [Desulfobacterales bacterium]|nr:hypothetical protein [Desulfobacterales bacterium]
SDSFQGFSTVLNWSHDRILSKVECRVVVLEKADAPDINGKLNDTRFISYIQLHEFEAPAKKRTRAP